MKKSKKEKRFYYILCGTEDFKKDKLEGTQLELGEKYLMTVSLTSNLGKVIRKEVHRKLKN